MLRAGGDRKLTFTYFSNRSTYSYMLIKAKIFPTYLQVGRCIGYYRSSGPLPKQKGDDGGMGAKRDLGSCVAATSWTPSRNQPSPLLLPACGNYSGGGFRLPPRPPASLTRILVHTYYYSTPSLPPLYSVQQDQYAHARSFGWVSGPPPSSVRGRFFSFVGIPILRPLVF